MKHQFKAYLKRILSGFLPYNAVAGALRYYQNTEENRFRPGEFLHYGKNVRIGAGVAISAPERLYVGDNVGIDPKCYIQAVGGCHIGQGSGIGAETIILTIEHQHGGGESIPYDSVRLVKPVYIEDYVWIGIRVSIAPGVRIGEGAIVGMGSVVVSDVPPLAIVMGNPAKVLTYRSKSDFDRLKDVGAAVDPYKELPLLKVPLLTRRKYKTELKEFGFDVSDGHEYFLYDKYLSLDKRLVRIEGKNNSSVVQSEIKINK